MPIAAVMTVCLNPAIDRVIEVDHFALGAHQVGREIMRTAGGKAINVSRVLAALGLRSVATGFLGEENRPSFAPVLDNPMVADEFFTLPGRTRENVTIADRAAHQETHIRDVGLEVDRRSLDRLSRKLRLMSRPESIVIFSGSLPPGISAEDFVGLVTVCAAAGARVAVDTSGPALRALAGRPLWLVKPNAIELGQLLGRELNSLDEQLQAAKEVAANVANVLFTRGGEGGYLFTDNAAVRAKAVVDPECLRNTVGCGDVLLGAFVAGISRGATARDAFLEAIAAASASACHVATAEFDPALAAQLRATLEVEPL